MTILLENPRRRGSRRRKASSRRRKTTRRRRRVSATRSNPAPRRRRRSRRKASKRRTHSRRRSNPFKIPGLGRMGGGVIGQSLAFFGATYIARLSMWAGTKLMGKVGIPGFGKNTGPVVQVVTSVALGWILKKFGGPLRGLSNKVVVGGIADAIYNLSFVPSAHDAALKVGLGDYAIGYGADSSDYGVGGTELYGMGDWVTRGQLSY